MCVCVFEDYALVCCGVRGAKIRSSALAKNSPRDVSDKNVKQSDSLTL